MKITTFNPQIMTKDAAPIVRLFEELGFEKRHLKEGIGELDVTGICLQDGNGFKLDISQNDVIPQEAMTLIRMNVDDFDETVKLLISFGFRDIYGAHPALTKTSKSTVMISPSGFAINVVKHIK